MTYVNSENRDLSKPDPICLPYEDPNRDNTPFTIDPMTFAIPWIKRLRFETGLGLKESKDVLDVVRAMVSGNPAFISHYSTLSGFVGANKDALASKEAAISAQAATIERLRESLATATEKIEASSRCVTCNVYLVDGEVGACSTFCFEQHREKIADERRVREIEGQIEGLRRDIRDLEEERSHLVAKHQPEANEDAPEIDWDSEPF